MHPHFELLPNSTHVGKGSLFTARRNC